MSNFEDINDEARMENPAAQGKPRIPKHVSVADKLLDLARVCDHKLFIYAKGAYTSDDALVKRAILEKWPYAKMKDLKEVSDRLLVKAKRVDGPSPEYVTFANGLLSISDWRLHSHTPEIFTTNMIPHDYIPPMEIPADVAKRVNHFLESFADGMPGRMLAIQEMIGLCLLPATISHTIFMLTGEGNNGKTTLISTLRALLGKDNFSAQNLTQMTSRFGTIGSYGKLAVLSDETIDDGASIEILKQLSGGSTICGELKYAQEPITFTPYATVIIVGNKLPRFTNYGKAARRRFSYIELTHDFSAEKSAGSDAEIKALLGDELAMSCMLDIALDGLRRVVESNGEVTKSEDNEILQREHEYAIDPVVAFVDDAGGPQAFTGMTVYDVWTRFSSYVDSCYPSSKKDAYSIKTFGKHFREVTQLKCETRRVSGKPTKVYAE